MTKVRYAVVGAGWISQIAFMPAIAQTGNSVMTAIVSGSKERSAELAAFHGVEKVYTYDDYDEMLAADVVDAVYIALPNSMHADYTIRALNAGKHALVEKPLATTEAECRAMVEAAEKNGVFLMTAYRLHTEPGTLDLLARIRAGEIGEPRHFTSFFSFVAAADNHRLEARHWGGPLQDLGVYCVNAVRHIFEAEPIQAVAVRSHGNGNPLFAEVEETIAATLTFPGGRIAQFIASFGADDMDFYQVSGTAGTLRMDPGYKFQTATRMTVIKGDDEETREFPQVDHFAGQADYFSSCILDGRPPEPDGHDGLADVVVLRAIERAAETGVPQPIDLPPMRRHPSADMLRMLPTTTRRLVY